MPAYQDDVFYVYVNVGTGAVAPPQDAVEYAYENFGAILPTTVATTKFAAGWGVTPVRLGEVTIYTDASAGVEYAYEYIV